MNGIGRKTMAEGASNGSACVWNHFYPFEMFTLSKEPLGGVETLSPQREIPTFFQIP